MARTPATSISEVDRPVPGRDSIAPRADMELLDSFRSDDRGEAESAFAELVARHGPTVGRVCLDVLGDRHEAQDAAQATFLVLARKSRSIRKPGSLGPWLHGVALRVARRALAGTIRRREVERRRAEAMAARSVGASPAASHPELHEEIDRLPDKYRTPIILCYFQGYTQEEAARVLGWPYGTVQIRLHRGRQRLRDRLARRGVGLMSLVGSAVTPPLFRSPAPDVSPAWAEATARAAVRFADGALVASATARLASSVLATMSRRWIKGVTVGLAGLACLPVVGFVVREVNPPYEGPTMVAARPGPASAPAGIDAPAAVVEAGEPPRTPDARSPADDFPVSATPARYLAAGPSGGSPAAAPADPARRGRELFERVWKPADPRSRGGDGLGPVFNARSCVDCHDRGGIGGAGASSRNVEIATAEAMSTGGQGFGYSFRMDFASGRFEYQIGNPAAPARREPADLAALAAIHPGFRESRSLILHRFGTDPAYGAWREAVPGRHGSVVVRTSLRNPPALFGLGLIDLIPDAAIVAAASRKSSGVAGRVGRLKDGRIGRFGWKAQTATLEEFVLSAAATEMGLELEGRPQAADPRLPGLGGSGPDMDRDDCEALVAFVKGLPAPMKVEPVDAEGAAAIKAGESAFRSIGCAGCHLPKLGEVEGLYSDLLLHDMSAKLADTGSYGVFTGPAAVDEPRGASEGTRLQEWRTPPLWGLRDSSPYLHDGRAATVEQAIALHGGQGGPSAARYARLSPRRKRQVEAFLLSLAAPPAEN